LLLQFAALYTKAGHYGHKCVWTWNFLFDTS
jgi:hypothetical protein